MKESWKDVCGYEGLYMISNRGNVKSLNYNHTGKERLLKIKRNRAGYCFVTLCNGKAKKNMSIHLLVARAFIPNDNGKPQVNHIDGDKLNNTVSNLEWVTASENIRHSFRKLGKESPNKGRFGGLHYASKPVYQYKLNGDFMKKWDCVSDAARAVGCKSCQIINNIKGRNRTCHGFMWRYEFSNKIDDSPVTSRKTHKKSGIL